MLIPQTEVVITANGAELGRYTVTPGEYVIGREGDIPVEADLVSRRHALLTVNYGDWLIEDLGSTNGTQLNGQPVSGATRVWPSQKIQVGAATIELHRVQTQPADGQSLSPLHGAPLEILYLDVVPVRDISVVRKMPLRMAYLKDCPIADVSPLAAVATLESVLLPPSAKNVETLRKHPKIAMISFWWDVARKVPNRTAAEFWKEFDAKNGAGK